MIVRGIGPSLEAFGVQGALGDPTIDIYDGSGVLRGSNDNWNDAVTRQEIIDSGLAPTNALESALWGTINPGAYTVVVRGKDNGTGVGLFEAYDLDQTVDSKLANVSTRGFVDTGDNVMIGGTIITGSTPATVLFRAIGPSLANAHVANALQDPTLDLHDGNGVLIASNDDWRSDQEAEIAATTIPPTDPFESAVLETLFPGPYTSIVRGFGNSTGVAVVEAYQLDSIPTSTPGLSITSTAFEPPTATVGTGYAAHSAVTATGGQTPYSWSATGLPNGMGINSSTGAVFGTPIAAGTFNVNVTVRDSSSPQKAASKTLPLTVH